MGMTVETKKKKQQKLLRQKGLKDRVWSKMTEKDRDFFSQTMLNL